MILSGQISHSYNDVGLLLACLCIAAYFTYYTYERFTSGNNSLAESFRLLFWTCMTAGLLISIFSLTAGFADSGTMIFFKNKLIIMCNQIIRQ